MNYSKRKIWLCWSLIGLNVLFIWGNSLMPREISSAFSKLVGKILSFLSGGGMDAVEGEGQGLLRKIAHFTEFCTLGLLLSWWARMIWGSKGKILFIPLLSGIAVAAVDEIIQIFVPGRGPGLRDVAIDAAGVVLGIAIIALICNCRKPKKSIIVEMDNEGISPE